MGGSLLSASPSIVTALSVIDIREQNGTDCVFNDDKRFSIVFNDERFSIEFDPAKLGILRMRCGATENDRTVGTPISSSAVIMMTRER
jgi:hypothetical protein